MNYKLLPVTISLVAGLAFGSIVYAAPEQIGWDELAPEIDATYENPFLTLTAEQMISLRRLLRIEQGLAVDDKDVAAEAAELRESLKQEGLDPDWLFEQRKLIIEEREAASRATNPEILGKSVRMPGYVLPLEIEGQRVTEFLLVPTVGACIHTPPPPANQMVHVFFPEGIEITGLYDPVWINGTMEDQYSLQNVSYIDGDGTVAVTYTMQPESVEPYSN